MSNPWCNLFKTTTRKTTPSDFDKDAPAGTVKDIKEQEVYMGEIPLMTEMVPL